MLEGRILVVDHEAVEIVLHDEVDDARNSVGTVYRRCAARQDLDALDKDGRHLVYVGRERERVAETHAMAVGQNQGAVRAEPTQVERGRTGCAVRLVGRQLGHNLGQVVDEILNANNAAILDFACIQCGDRRRTGQVCVLLDS